MVSNKLRQLDGLLFMFLFKVLCRHASSSEIVDVCDETFKKKHVFSPKYSEARRRPVLHSPSAPPHSGHLVIFQAIGSWICNHDFLWREKDVQTVVKKKEVKTGRVSRSCQVGSDARLTRCYHIVIWLVQIQKCVYFSCLSFFTSFAAIFLTFTLYFSHTFHFIFASLCVCDIWRNVPTFCLFFRP